MTDHSRVALLKFAKCHVQLSSNCRLKASALMKPISKTRLNTSSLGGGRTFLTGQPLQQSSPWLEAPPRPNFRLKVESYKKKGKKLMRSGPDGVYGKQMRPAAEAQKKIQELPVDPENEEFIMFVRSRLVPKWIPYTVMKGGWSANALAKAQGTKLGKNLYGSTLIKNIGQAFYKDINSIENSIRQNIKILKHARELEYGFKIRDKSKPDEWYLTDGIQLLPSKEEVETGGILENVKDFFAGKKKLF